MAAAERLRPLCCRGEPRFQPVFWGCSAPTPLPYLFIRLFIYFCYSCRKLCRSSQPKGKWQEPACLAAAGCRGAHSGCLRAAGACPGTNPAPGGSGCKPKG